jgi:hypothetical protein
MLTRIASRVLVVVVVVLAGMGVAPAQVDLAKVLVGKWEGEQEMMTDRSANPARSLEITSVKQEDGKWVADGRFGTPGGAIGRVKIEIDNSGKIPSLRWTGSSGAAYDLSLLNEKNLAGKVTLTMGQGGSQRGRERSLRLQKKD